MSVPAHDRKKLPRPLRSISRIVGALTLVYFALAILVWTYGEAMVFMPAKFPEGRWEPPPSVEEVWFTGSDGSRLHAWWKEVVPSGLTILVCHGNGGNVTDRRETFEQLADLEVNVLIFDYRGYGKSEGIPTEEAVYQDAEAAWDFVVSDKKVLPKRIVLLGQSLGAAIALHLASKKVVGAVILEAPFASIRAMASKVSPLIPLGWAMKARFDTVEKARSLKVPLLIVHGERDEIVPISQGRQVYQTATGPKTWQTIPGGGHNDLWSGDHPSFHGAIRKFLAGFDSQKQAP